MKLNIHTRLRPKHGIDLAPMVDIVFLLVAYFLLNTTVIKHPTINIELPKSNEAIVQKHETITLYVTDEQNLFIDDTISTLETLEIDLQKIIENKKSESLIIKGDKNVNYQVIIKVMDTVHRLGITKFHLATQK